MREPSKHPARPISLSVGLIACGALLAPLPALALDNPTLGGIGAGDGDYLEYNSRPDSLVPCDSVTITPFCTFLNDGAYPPSYPYQTSSITVRMARRQWEPAAPR